MTSVLFECLICRALFRSLAELLVHWDRCRAATLAEREKANAIQA
jgi:hypothetical protein